MNMIWHAGAGIGLHAKHLGNLPNTKYARARVDASNEYERVTKYICIARM